MKNDYHSRKLFEILKKGRFSEYGCLEWSGPFDSDGYGITTLSENRIKKTVKLHRLIWILLNGDIESCTLICHACDNPKCFNLCHLFEGSPRDNALDRKNKNRNGNQNGERNGSNKLVTHEVLTIRKLYDEGVKVSELVKMFDVEQSHISRILRREAWKHV